MSNSIIVITEALDAVFDVFAEGGIADEALVSTGLATQLRQMPPLLKAKVSLTVFVRFLILACIDTGQVDVQKFISECFDLS